MIALRRGDDNSFEAELFAEDFAGVLGFDDDGRRRLPEPAREAVLDALGAKYDFERIARTGAKCAPHVRSLFDALFRKGQ